MQREMIGSQMFSVNRYVIATLVGASGLLAPVAARADSVRTDFDGDGIRDRIEVSARSTELAVRLSNGRTVQRLEADDLIFRFVVADVDRDGDPDVVATTGRSGLQIWINRGSGRFTALHVIRHAQRRARHFLDDHTRPGDLGNVWNDTTRTFIAAVSRAGRGLRLFFAPTAAAIRSRRNPIARGAPHAAPLRFASRERPHVFRLLIADSDCRVALPCVLERSLDRTPPREARRSIMRIVLADLASADGFVSKDTVAGGYGSRLRPFSRVTQIISAMKRHLHALPSVQLGYISHYSSNNHVHKPKTTRNIRLVSSLINYQQTTSTATTTSNKSLKTNYKQRFRRKANGSNRPQRTTTTNHNKSPTKVQHTKYTSSTPTCRPFIGNPSR